MILPIYLLRIITILLGHTAVAADFVVDASRLNNSAIRYRDHAQITRSHPETLFICLLTWAYCIVSKQMSPAYSKKLHESELKTLQSQIDELRIAPWKVDRNVPINIDY